MSDEDEDDVVTYEPFGDELNVEVALLQAASTLDLAVVLAIESKDAERLQALALSWMELAKILFSPPHQHDDDEDEEPDNAKPRVIGFGKVNEDGELERPEE